MVNIFKFLKGAEQTQRDRVYKCYCLERDLVRKTHPFLSESKQRRVAVDNLSKDLMKVIDDLHSTIRKVLKDHERLEE